MLDDVIFILSIKRRVKINSIPFSSSFSSVVVRKRIHKKLNSDSDLC